MQSSNYIICLEEIQTLTKNIRQFSRESRSKRKPIYFNSGNSLIPKTKFYSVFSIDPFCIYRV